MRPSMDYVLVWTMGPTWIENFGHLFSSTPQNICGVEELASYFHAKNIMYFDFLSSRASPTSYAEALSKLKGFRKVICSINDYSEPSKRAHAIEGKALELSQASNYHTNVIGGIIDDLSSAYKLTSQELECIRAALIEKNPSLKLFGVIYTHHLDLNLTKCAPYIGVVSLWVWQNRDLKNLDTYLEQCSKIFPGKPIFLGLYMFDFPSNAPMPMDLLKFEFNKAVQYIREKKITGFQILGRYLRSDLGSDQALWIKNFLEENFSA